MDTHRHTSRECQEFIQIIYMPFWFHQISMACPVTTAAATSASPLFPRQPTVLPLALLLWTMPLQCRQNVDVEQGPVTGSLTVSNLQCTHTYASSQPQCAHNISLLNSNSIVGIQHARDLLVAGGTWLCKTGPPSASWPCSCSCSLHVACIHRGWQWL